MPFEYYQIWKNRYFLLDPKPNFHTVSKAIVQFCFDQNDISNFYDNIHGTIKDRIQNELNDTDDRHPSKNQ
jgi:hypothetical protein